MDEAHRMVADRYELAEVIGRGGMGTVYRAVDVVLGRSVAVKILPGSLADRDPTSVARFVREARAAAALSHRGVVAVYDTGADETGRYIVMELIPGRSLETILREDGPLDPQRATEVAAGIADALAAAHAAGIVHRDIKPANVMVAPDGTVKVLDFGIARAIDSTAITQDASVLGTAAYMSPEQALGQPADERSDIYSLGCVLYALLAGHPPFTGDSAAAVLNQHANLAPKPLLEENRRVSPELSALVTQMLAKAPRDRPRSATEVRDRLAGAAQPAARLVPQPRTAPTAPIDQTGVTRRLPPPAAQDLPAGPNRRRLIAAGALAVALAAIAIVALASSGGSPAKRSGRVTTTRTVKHRAKPALTTTSTTATTATTAPATATTTTTTPPKPPTVGGTAGALTALATQDAQAGTIDQQAAQQISNGLGNVLNAYEQGNPMNAQQQLQNLDQQIAMLEQQGHISSAAAPGLNRALARFSAALGSAAPATTTPSGPPTQAGPPPGHSPGHGGKHQGHGGPAGH